MEPPGNSHAWAEILGIDEASVRVQLQYLVETKKIDGVPIFMPGSTLLQTVIVQRLTASGIDFVEANFAQDHSESGNIIVTAQNVIGSQFATGEGNTQIQTVSIESFDQLYQIADNLLNESQRAILKPLLKEVEDQVKRGSLEPSTLRKIGEVVKAWGPSVAGSILDAIMKLLFKV